MVPALVVFRGREEWRAEFVFLRREDAREGERSKRGGEVGLDREKVLFQVTHASGKGLRILGFGFLKAAGQMSAGSRVAPGEQRRWCIAHTPDTDSRGRKHSQGLTFSLKGLLKSAVYMYGVERLL